MIAKWFLVNQDHVRTPGPKAKSATMNRLGIYVAFCAVVLSAELSSRCGYCDELRREDALSSELRARGYDAIPLTAKGNELFLPVRINGQLFDFKLDTGSIHSAMDRSVAVRLGMKISSEEQRPGPVSGTFTVGSTSPRELTIDSIGIRPSALEVISLIPAQHNSENARYFGLIGQDFLLYHLALIDYGQSILFLLRPERELELLKGRWRCVSCEMGGKAEPQDITSRRMLVIKGDSLEVHDGDQVRSFSYQVEVNTGIRQIDLTPHNTTQPSHTTHGIFKLNGDELLLCIERPDAQKSKRPTEFSGANPDYRLLRFLRGDSERKPLETPSDKKRLALSRLGYLESPMFLDRDGFIKVAATIEGKRCTLIVDTGTVNTAIDSTFAQTLKLPLEKGPDQGSLTGSISTQIAHLKSIHLGKMAFGRADVLVVDLKALNKIIKGYGGEAADGILGANALKPCRAVVDYHDRQIYLWSARTEYAAMMRGDWQCIQHEKSGRASSNDDIAKMFLTVRETHFVFRDSKATTKSDYEVGAAQGAWAEIDVREVDNKANKRLGIFAPVDGNDLLVLVLAANGETNRPTGSETKGTNWSRWVFKRKVK